MTRAVNAIDLLGTSRIPFAIVQTRCASWFVLASIAAVSPVAAQSSETEGTTIATEAPDATRLDVERLPPEALRITRDLYAHGVVLDIAVGGRGYVGGIGRISSPGPYAAVGVGYEIFEWLLVKAIFDISFHQTSAPTPPSRAGFEVLSGLGELKLQVNPTAEFGLWLAGQVGISVATTDVLVLYGVQDASTVGLAYGGEVGVDAHFHSRHVSIGLASGVRLVPGFEGFDGETAIGVHGAGYLRYVF